MSKNLSPDEWVNHIEQMHGRSREQADVQQSPLSETGRPTRETVVEDDIDSWTCRRKDVFKDVNWTNDWTTEKYEVEYVRRGWKRYTLACSCGNTRDDPKQFCVHRARCEWLRYYNHGVAHEYDGLPDEWELTYSEYKQNGETFDWNLVD